MTTTDTAEFIEKISKNPLNPSLHLEYALNAFKRGRHYLPYAELKMAEYLGMDKNEIKKHETEILSAIPKAEKMNHNLYYRFTTLAQELKNISTTKEFSVLDVGGGEGQLAAFIPEASYCLAEPTINGISGINLPFTDNSFDYVVSCHVLEHIPINDRWTFLDQLLSKSKKGVVLLNPFHIDIEGSPAEDRIKIVVDITDSPWAKEHLECTLPNLEDMKNYAKIRGLKITIKPSGTMTTSMACVFMDYFANKAGLRAELGEVHEFFNTNFKSILDNNEHPTAYIVIFEK